MVHLGQQKTTNSDPVIYCLLIASIRLIKYILATTRKAGSIPSNRCDYLPISGKNKVLRHISRPYKIIKCDINYQVLLHATCCTSISQLSNLFSSKQAVSERIAITSLTPSEFLSSEHIS